MTQETAKERIYREALKKTRERLGSFEELYANKGVYYAFYELTGLVEKGLKQGSKIPVTTDELSVEKLEPIGYYNEVHGFLHDEFDKDCYCQGGCSMEAVYTESQVKKSTGENKTEKLQEQLGTAKKALTESEEKYQKQMDRFLNSEMNESARSHCESQLKLLSPAHKAYEALAAIGGDDE